MANLVLCYTAMVKNKHESDDVHHEKVIVMFCNKTRKIIQYRYPV